MLFLIQYNRPKGQIIRLDIFSDSQRKTAEKSRLTLEIDLNRKRIDDEVVLLQAKNESALRRTHRRYFEDLSQLLAG